MDQRRLNRFETGPARRRARFSLRQAVRNTPALHNGRGGAGCGELPEDNKMKFTKRHLHPRAELVCPPLRWRTVGGHVTRAAIVAGATGAAGAFALMRWHSTSQRWALVLSVTLLGLSVSCLLRLAHLLNAARMPVTFRIANAELVVTRPFLLWRRSRRLPTASVRAVTVSAHPSAITTTLPTGRMSIRRRRRLPIRVPGRRPLVELNRVAEELRAVLRV
jgi:hypothetical protein